MARLHIPGIGKWNNLKFRHFIFLSLVFISLILISFFFIGYSPVNQNVIKTDNIYKTWKLDKFYQNGKVVNDKFHGLRLRVNRDGSAEWLRPGTSLKISFKISEDGSLIKIDDGYTVEDYETIFELTKDKLRFGKRNIVSRYEYVMIPDNN